ncbi:hypothetical protein ANTPLA_LOCUS714 [Anthophora plagiata]
MILCYGASDRSVENAMNLYAAKFPEKNVPSRATFYRVVKLFLQARKLRLLTTLTSALTLFLVILVYLKPVLSAF